MLYGIPILRKLSSNARDCTLVRYRTEKSEKVRLLSLISFSNAEIMASASSNSSRISINPNKSPEPLVATKFFLARRSLWVTTDVAASRIC